MDTSNRYRNLRGAIRSAGADLSPAGAWSRTGMRMGGLLLLHALCLCLLAAGCARPRVQYEEIFHNDRIHVRLLERLDKSGSAVTKGFDHPWDVKAAVLDDMLQSIRYKTGKGVIGAGKLREAFPERVRHTLLKPLQRAFAKAGPDQEVDFSFVEIKSTLKVFRRSYFTDGVMFRKEGRLNVAFRNLALEQIGGVEQDDFAPNRQDPTASPMRTSWTLVAGDGQSLVRARDSGILGRSTYSNWVRLDLSWPWGVSDAAILEQAMPGMVDDLGKALDEKSPLPAPNSPSREELQKRLQFLEELRREGTITERAYREKKQELEGLYHGAPEK